MYMTQNLAELCALLVEDVFGELPSRIITALLSKGRSSIGQLMHYTSLQPRQVRHGLLVLIQHELIYYRADDGPTIYTANPTNLYALVRIGKVLHHVQTSYGSQEVDVMKTVMSLGHAKVKDIVQACLGRGTNNGTTNGEHLNGHSSTLARINGINGHDTADEAGYMTAIGSLVTSELLGLVTEATYTSNEDQRSAIEATVKRDSFPAGAKGTADHAARVATQLWELKSESLQLKRKLVAQETMSNKRRKLNGADAAYASTPSVRIDPEAVLCLNAEKVAVYLRNQRLADYVAEYVGEATADVYATVLLATSQRISHCQVDASFGNVNRGMEVDEDGLETSATITTQEIFTMLDTSLDLYVGLGKVPTEHIDRRSALQIVKHPPDYQAAPLLEAKVVGSASSDEDVSDFDMDGDGDDDSEAEPAHRTHINGKSAISSNTPINGSIKTAKVQFSDSQPPKLSRIDQLKQHLLVLCEANPKFLRHSDTDAWTIDFPHLIRTLRTIELDTLIERSSGTTGLRLVRMLRQKGKLDEKTLYSLALIPKSEAQRLFLQMQMLGYVDIQEVPRDNARTPSRTMFLYWTDTERCLDRMLDTTYKTMVRCCQVLKVHRAKEKDLLAETGREDVRGKERELLEDRAYARWERIMAVQEKVLGQVARLDDLVGVLRDF